MGEQRGRLDDALLLRSALEFRDKVAGTDVVRVLQRFGLMARVTGEVGQVATELGAEGGRVGVQLAHHTEGAAETELLVIRDYLRTPDGQLPTWSDALQVAEHLKQRARENRLDAVEAGRWGWATPSQTSRRRHSRADCASWIASPASPPPWPSASPPKSAPWGA